MNRKDKKRKTGRRYREKDLCCIFPRISKVFTIIILCIDFVSTFYTIKFFLKVESLVHSKHSFISPLSVKMAWITFRWSPSIQFQYNSLHQIFQEDARISSKKLVSAFYSLLYFLSPLSWKEITYLFYCVCLHHALCFLTWPFNSSLPSFVCLRAFWWISFRYCTNRVQYIGL